MSYFSERKASTEQAINYELHAEFPRNALIELSNACNHACLFCTNSVMVRKVGMLNIDSYKSFLVQALDLGLKEVGLYTTGEPFVVQNLAEYIKIAKNMGVERVYLTSNGALATREKIKECLDAGLDSLKFSVNAIDRDTYKVVHGKDDWLKVYQNILDAKQLQTEYKYFQILATCTMTKITGDISSEFKKLFSGVFEDVLFRFAEIQGGHNGEYIDAISFKPKSVKLEVIKPCHMLWSRVHLTCEGYLTACCIDYDQDLVYADLNQVDLKTGWNCETIKNLRNAHLQKNLDGLLCHSCLTKQTHDYSPLNTQIPARLISEKHKEEKIKKYEQRFMDVVK